MTTPADSNVVQLYGSDPRVAGLHDELYDVILQDKYNPLALAQVVGVLEFLKWNLINRG